MSAAAARKPRAELARIEIVDVTVITGTKVHKHATIVTRIGGHERTFESTGKRNGPIDAICHAFEPLVGEFTCAMWSGRGEGGSDVVGSIDVTIKRGDQIFSGTGRHTDTMHATALAVADALNKHLLVEHKNQR